MKTASRFLLLALLLSPEVGRGEVTSLTLHRREAFAGGAAFGDVGPYERLVGVAWLRSRGAAAGPFAPA